MLTAASCCHARYCRLAGFTFWKHGYELEDKKDKDSDMGRLKSVLASYSYHSSYQDAAVPPKFPTFCTCCLVTISRLCTCIAHPFSVHETYIAVQELH